MTCVSDAFNARVLTECARGQEIEPRKKNSSPQHHESHPCSKLNNFRLLSLVLRQRHSIGALRQLLSLQIKIEKRAALELRKKKRKSSAGITHRVASERARRSKVVQNWRQNGRRKVCLHLHGSNGRGRREATVCAAATSNGNMLST